MALTEYVIMPGADYQDACNAIREKDGSSAMIKSGDMGSKIRAISDGGSDWKCFELVNGQCAVTDEEYNTYFTGDDSILIGYMDCSPVGYSVTQTVFKSFKNGKTFYFVIPAYDVNNTTGVINELSTTNYSVINVDGNSIDGYTINIVNITMNGTNVTNLFIDSSVPQRVYASARPWA